METITETKPDLTFEQKREKQFEVTKHVAIDLIYKKKCHLKYDSKQVREALIKSGLREEMVLLDCLDERVNKHNGIIDRTIKNIQNLRYDRRGYYSASLKGLHFDSTKIEKLVAANQHWKAWDISTLYFNPDHKPDTRFQ